MTSQLADKIIAYRRELHQNPELSNHEFATTARLIRWLQEAGIRLLPLALKTGVVAEIGSGQGPIIALRGDIDALPIDEIADVPFSSQNSGVMHACGHDFHTSVMLGAAHLLKAREAELAGTVRIFFQPAEETFNGARHLIDAGALDNVAAIFGLHNAPELPTGTPLYAQAWFAVGGEVVTVDLSFVVLLWVAGKARPRLTTIGTSSLSETSDRAAAMTPVAAGSR